MTYIAGGGGGGSYAILNPFFSCVNFSAVWLLKWPCFFFTTLDQHILTFLGPCIAHIFAEYNQKDATFHNFFISIRRSTCFRRFFRPSSGTQKCTYSVRYLSDQYLTLYAQFWAPDDGRKNRLKHVERVKEIKKFWIVACCWLYSANILVNSFCKELLFRIFWKSNKLFSGWSSHNVFFVFVKNA